MSTKFNKFTLKFSAAFWLALASTLLIVFVVILYLLQQKLNEDLETTQKTSKNQFESIAAIITSEINTEQYQHIEPLFNQWAQSNDAILEMRLLAANGFNLASYKRPSDDQHFFSFQIPISYSYHDEASFYVRISLERIYRRSHEFTIQVACIYIVFSFLLVYVFRMATQLQRQALKSRYLADLYKAQSEINQAIVRMDQQDNMFPLITRCAVEFGGMGLAWVGLLDETSQQIIPVVWYENHTMIQGDDLLKNQATIEGLEMAMRAVSNTRPTIINNYVPKQNNANIDENKRFPYQSAATFPIFKMGKPYAVLQVFQTEPDSFKAEEITLLAELSRDVTFALENFEREVQRKNTAESLKMTASVYAFSNEGIMIINAFNHIVSINTAFTKMTGYSENEIVGSNPSILSPHLYDETFFNTNWQDINDHGKWTSEIFVRRKNGEVYPALIFVSVVYDENKNITHYVASHVDILEKKKQENQLIESERRLTEILNLSPIAIRIITQKTRKVVFYNESYANLNKNYNLSVLNPRENFRRKEEFDDMLGDLALGLPVLNRPIELEVPDKPNKWMLISLAKIQYQGEDAVLGWLYDISELKEAEEKIRDLAFHDPLTRLPNRQLLMDRLQQALVFSMRSKRFGAMLFIDLDNFKVLNDTFGHHMGDMMLRQVAERLRSTVREIDTVARIGGDEFVVLLEDLSAGSLDAAAITKKIGEKILSGLEQPYQLSNGEFRTTASIGATLIDERQAVEELFKQADIAMYQAKKEGRNSLRFFDPQMQESINSRALLENQLRTAIEQQQFQLHYQVQVDGSGQPIGAEALIRWIHPEQGLISPFKFIPIAEETGLILRIGQWVLETACAQIKHWQQDKRTNQLVLAVNVSAKQFHQFDFVSSVEIAMKLYDIKPGQLKLELTESMLVENIDDIIITMNALKKMGVLFSLDDFGTGYSSLQYLKLLPIDQLKVDQSFIRDIGSNNNNEALVRTIIAMGHSLNLEVIAEGVETEEQRQFLIANGCTFHQGYLFSKPVPIEQFQHLIT